MKKKVKVLVVLILVLLCSTSCKLNKTPKDLQTFSEIMEAEGFSLLDATDQFEEGSVESVTLAVNEKYQIEFFVMQDEASAVRAFAQNKYEFELYEKATGRASYTSVTMGNHGSYKLTAAGDFYVVSRIENTFLYIVTEVENKDDVNNILKKLGY